MKVILSRKGFDSANGGILSPIIDNRTMLSLPIPSQDSIRYDELRCNGVGLKKILQDLGYDFRSDYCHLDPDLDHQRRKKPVKDWCPAFGQTNQSAGYLRNCGVGVGDLFLFFGSFRHIIMNQAGNYQYAGSADPNDDYYGKPIQAIWGYMQVGQVIRDSNEIKKLWWHPHSCAARIREPNNTIYLAAKRLSFAPGLPGCGIFDYDPKRVLTMAGRSKATWKDEAAYRNTNLVKTASNKTRKNSAKNGTGIYYAGIWQELVLKDDNNNTVAETWAKTLF